MKFYFRLTSANRLTLPYVLHHFARVKIPEEDVVIGDVGKLKTEISKLTPAERREAVVLYSFMTPHIRQVMEEVQSFKRNFPELLMVAGGPHSTGDPFGALKMGFDVVYAGELENGFDQWFGLLLEKRHSSVPWIFQGGNIRTLDHFFPVGPYFSFYPPLEITRGCFWKCKFCQTATRKILHRSVESVQHYIDILHEKKLLNRVSFVCPSASEYGAESPRELRLDRIQQVLDYTRRKGGKFIEFGIFPSETRPNRLTEEFLTLVKDYCSNKKITIGAQVASDHMLRKLRRGHTLEHVVQATEMVYRKGFIPLLDFIIGFPEETTEDRRKTFEYMKILAKQYRARIHTHYFLPLSGTPLAHNLPSPLDEESKQILRFYHQAGIASSWWEEGMRRSAEIVETLRKLENTSLPEFEMIHAADSDTCIINGDGNKDHYKPDDNHNRR